MLYRRAVVLTAIGFLLGIPSVGSAGPWFFGNSDAVNMRLRSVKELRLQRMFRTTLHQKYDFSCGSAAVATLLTYHYNRPVSEAQVFQVMYERGDKAKIQKQGFSLLDMKRYLESQGYQGDGYEVGLDKLVEARVPGIALVRENGYNHFVVIKGANADKVLLGDPAMGTRVMTRSDFNRIWHGGIIFVIRNHTEVARFNEPDHWRVQLAAPLDADSINRVGLASPTLMMRGPNDF
jgi:predicted double-glycine peptidase